MTIPFSASGDWETEGRKLASALNSVSAVIVTARDPAMAVGIAIGMARAQGESRRVAIADLIGESPALDSLLSNDDPHGIADSFLYGVSLNRIARPMRDTKQIFVMPGGTEAVADAAVYGNDRWRRLAAGFAEVGALLIAVANPAVSAFPDLCGYFGTVMTLDRDNYDVPEGVKHLRAVAERPQSSRTPEHATVLRAREAAQSDPAGRRNGILALLLVLGAVAIVIGAMRPDILSRLPAPVLALFGRGSVADSANTVVPPTRMDDSPEGDSSGRDDLQASGLSTMSSQPPDLTPLVLENPADSASSSRYAVFFATANTPAAALSDSKVRSLDALALSPVLESGEQWYRLTIGALPSRTEADRFLADLRARKVLSEGSIVSVPYALRLDNDLSSDLVASRLAALSERGIMAYALRQEDGSVSLYTGAFESEAQAGLLADSLRIAGFAPVLAYRTGRVF